MQKRISPVGQHAAQSDLQSTLRLLIRTRGFKAACLYLKQPSEITEAGIPATEKMGKEENWRKTKETAPEVST